MTYDFAIARTFIGLGTVVERKSVAVNCVTELAMLGATIISPGSRIAPPHTG